MHILHVNKSLAIKEQAIRGFKGAAMQGYGWAYRDQLPCDTGSN